MNPGASVRDAIPNASVKPMGYEKSAHFYDLFDTKENIEFFHFASEAGEILDIGVWRGIHCKISKPFVILFRF